MDIEERKLPKNFAQKVLDLESELDLNKSIPIIKKLLKLYSTAVQYYSSISDDKYIHYKRRLQNMLQEQEVREMFDNTVRYKPKPKPINLKPPTPKMNVERKMDKHFVLSSTVSSRARQNLRSQESLDMRLQNRRSSNSLRKKSVLSNPSSPSTPRSMRMNRPSSNNSSFRVYSPRQRQAIKFYSR